MTITSIIRLVYLEKSKEPKYDEKKTAYMEYKSYNINKNPNLNFRV